METTACSRPDEPAGFAALGLSPVLRAAIEAAGYHQPTLIQVRAIPHVLEGHDVLGRAQTGTGKTAAFALPILQHLAMRTPGNGRRLIRALVLAPTRELAAQIGDSFGRYGRGGTLRHLVVFGGVGKPPQIAALRRGIDVLVATPGRLLDLMSDGHVSLSHVRHFVLDEGDRMLDMGFIHDVRRITRALPAERQTLLFSATVPHEIRELAGRLLRNPVHVAIEPVAGPREPISERLYFVDGPAKVGLLLELLRGADIDRALVFTRTKHGANKVARKLEQARVAVAAIHGNKSQSARERALDDFKRGSTRVVVATDIAARGLDIKGLSHVINFDLPRDPESYVHRIGRTGRAGATGIALSFCAADESGHLAAIERLTRRRIDRQPGHTRPAAAGEPAPRERRGRNALGRGRGARARGWPSGGSPR